ncbi:copper resistance CopC family protein [Leucobacter aridicollis]|uniref:copper resistance CopC family protein n=1 Tax=Leucobacter aridicollis TaxID=283878 RepID=UPI0021057489|nr:copper resistance CopC family protein [Leucobacter aridicollis]UTX52217.1 copper resistance protein CopC [Leucobacter aridicollis]
MHSHTHIQAARIGRQTKTARTLALAAAAGVALAAFFAPSAAQAHDQLIDVAIDTTDTGEASGLRLTFSDTVLEVGTEIHVSTAEGGDATGGDPTFSDRDVVQPLATPLADGTYTSAWRVVSSDGHPIEGGFTFDIADGAPGEIRPYSGETETPAEPEALPETPSTDDGATDSNGSPIPLPLAIGAAAVVAVAVAIPLIVRMRRNASSAEGHDPRTHEE